ncbi:hypothetical protein OEZ85_004056 [Tetradesmus obliquus]|uniref:Uncharacterized protein n=1 Tax=Tetradesmus obliquus TaxID=3088 RepID=A0ABY8UDJ9_TETOB|nr:hypothetical protein OEZ85_004056 [Tetradesmus obliquus]
MQPAHTPGDWKVDVRFKEKGNLQAVASGVLLVPPSDALALVTDSGMPARRKPAHDSSGSVQEEPRTVTFNLLSSNMLHSLSGNWRLQPLKIHHTALPRSCLSSSSSSSSMRHTAVGKQPLSPYTLSFLASSSRGSSPGLQLPAGLRTDADGNVTATLVQYEQYAQPKGLPPGVRFVPGMSDAVRSSIGREVRQMLEKIGHAAMLEVQHGIAPQAALAVMTQQLEQAGGSFKKLQKQQLAAAAAAAAAAGPKALPGQLVGAFSSHHNDAAGQQKLADASSSSSRSIAAHPLMSISALTVTEE